jgi:hypothetical protein
MKYKELSWILSGAIRIRIHNTDIAKCEVENLLFGQLSQWLQNFIWSYKYFPIVEVIRTMVGMGLIY